MADGYASPRRAGVMLFGEDFDLPPPSRLDPDVIEPTFSTAELMAAREQAARDSRDETIAETEASGKAVAVRALAEIAAQLASARAEVETIAEQSSEAIARLVLDCFATAFPALSARHGPREVSALLRELLPALRHEPTVTIRINPHIAEAVTGELHALDADLAERVRLIPTDRVAPGDVRVSWENGAAVRDTASLWYQIETVLSSAGLSGEASAPVTVTTAKEHEHVE
jgi:flagellar assembly protein FliH